MLLNRVPATRSTRRLLAGLQAFGLGLVTLGCAPEPPPRPQRVLMILIDTLRADRLGVYGYDRDTSPSIDRLAERGARFLTCRSTSSWTQPAVASLFTGLMPEAHGMEQGGVRSVLRGEIEALADEVTTLAEGFRTVGYTTHAWVSNPHLSAATGLDQGFDRFERGAMRRDGLMDLFVAWLDSDPAVDEGTVATGIDPDVDPWFSYLHLMHPHLPYPSTPEGLERFPPRPGSPRPVPEEALRRLGRQRLRDTNDLGDYQARYDAAVFSADRQIGRALDALESRGLLEDTLVIVLSDHGDELLEHGNLNHGRGLYEEVVRVPLVVSYPRAIEGGLEIEAPVSLLDVYPTLAEWFGFEEGPVGQSGRSLLGVLTRSEELAVRPQRLTHLPMSGHRKGRLDVWIEDDRKLLVWPRQARVELYDLDSDPREQRDLAASETRVVRQLFERLSADRERASGTLPPGSREVRALPDELREQLEALGYLDSGDPPADDASP